MKARIAGILTLLFFTLKSFAGYDVVFCANFDSLGHCTDTSNDEFKWNGDRLTVSALIINKDGLNTTKLSLRVFEMKSPENADLAADLVINVYPRRLYTTKDIYFFKPGRYKVDIYDARDALVYTTFLTILDR